MINVTLLKQTLAHIEANPDEWFQADYRCGSGLCFAGWAAQLAGGKWYTDNPDSAYPDELIAVPEDGVDVFRIEPGVWATSAAKRAERVLGLTPGQASDLFYGRNTLDHLRALVADLCGEAA